MMGGFFLCAICEGTRNGGAYYGIAALRLKGYFEEIRPAGGARVLYLTGTCLRSRISVREAIKQTLLYKSYL